MPPLGEAVRRAVPWPAGPEQRPRIQLTPPGQASGVTATWAAPLTQHDFAPPWPSVTTEARAGQIVPDCVRVTQVSEQELPVSPVWTVT